MTVADNPSTYLALLSRTTASKLTAVGVFFKPGEVFRDCADCPEMVVIPAGSFRMGDLSGGGGGDEKPVHRVTIPRPFAVGKYEVTQAEWRAVMGSNPSWFKGDRNPVEEVRWNDAQDFVRRLNTKTGKQYRLLTEAEWEYAARAGTTTQYSWGDSVGSGNANCNGCGSRWDNDQPAPVGSFNSNRFGLHDMLGNVWEWVEDCYNDSYNGAPADGSAQTGLNFCNRVTRGGSWNNYPGFIRAADRYGTSQSTETAFWDSASPGRFSEAKALLLESLFLYLLGVSRGGKAASGRVAVPPFDVETSAAGRRYQPRARGWAER